MSRFLRWTRRVAFALVLLAAGAWVVIHALSERILRRHWEVPAAAFTVPEGPEAVARGEHIAVTRGCPGCHGSRLQGGVFYDQARVARLVAPNLARLARDYSVAELERAIRHGVRRDGTTVRGMPSETFYQLTDRDLGDLIAFLRSVPPADDPLPATEIRILGRIGLVTGKYQLATQLIDPSVPRRPPADPADPVSRGRYLAHTMCVECHGLDLHGYPDDSEPTPHLALVAAYTPEEFAHLMRTGEPAQGGPLKLMAAVARERFAHLTDAEVSALYEYLRLLADPAAVDRL
jgi:mono/diheme cytochrome c family protein